MKPGITGRAQVNGWRGETDTIDKIMQRVNRDLYYIGRWSILFDLYIVLMAPGCPGRQNRERRLTTVGSIDGSLAGGSAELALAVVRTHAKRLFDSLIMVWIFCGSLVLIETSPL